MTAILKLNYFHLIFLCLTRFDLSLFLSLRLKAQNIAFPQEKFTERSHQLLTNLVYFECVAMTECQKFSITKCHFEWLMEKRRAREKKFIEKKKKTRIESFFLQHFNEKEREKLCSTNQTFIWLQTEFLTTNHEFVWNSNKKCVKTEHCTNKWNGNWTKYYVICAQKWGSEGDWNKKKNEIWLDVNFNKKGSLLNRYTELNKHPIKWYGLLCSNV